MKLLRHADVLKLLRDRVEQAGSILAAARYLDISDTLLGDVLGGRRPISRAILNVLGLRVAGYELIRRKAQRARR